MFGILFEMPSERDWVALHRRRADCWNRASWWRCQKVRLKADLWGGRLTPHRTNELYARFASCRTVIANTPNCSKLVLSHNSRHVIIMSRQASIVSFFGKKASSNPTVPAKRTLLDDDLSVSKPVKLPKLDDTIASDHDPLSPTYILEYLIKDRIRILWYHNSARPKRLEKYKVIADDPDLFLQKMNKRLPSWLNEAHMDGSLRDPNKWANKNNWCLSHPLWNTLISTPNSIYTNFELLTQELLYKHLA